MFIRVTKMEEHPCLHKFLLAPRHRGVLHNKISKCLDMCLNTRASLVFYKKVAQTL